MASRKRTPRAQEAPAAEPVLEAVDEGQGLNIDGGIIIATFLLLVSALSVIWYLMDARYPGT